jgi:hypothetical protein
MLKSLKLKNVGPQDELEIEFAERLNIVTGDNGLGKSFLLDIAWWALTRRWPAEVNPGLTSGYAAKPRGAGDAFIEFEVMSLTKEAKHRAIYDRREQAWLGKPGRPAMPGLVIYAQVDGGYSVWDPARNYWITRGNVDVQERLPAYVFSPKDVWDGLEFKGSRVCNGLIADWAGWQKEKNGAFQRLQEVLRELSSGDGEPLEIGALTRIGIDDVRDIPTVRMPYGDVAIVYASAAVRRIVALAYLMVWASLEHLKACEQMDLKPARQLVLLIDEIECHLHPRWQRLIVPALLKSIGLDSSQMKLQVIAATHSPLVLASLEPIFDSAQDAWFDLDMDASDGKVELRKREFERRGDASKWLMSEAFDLKQAGSIGREQAIEALARLIENPDATASQIQVLGEELESVVSDRDPVWARWRMLAEKKGLQG